MIGQFLRKLVFIVVYLVERDALLQLHRLSPFKHWRATAPAVTNLIAGSPPNGNPIWRPPNLTEAAGRERSVGVEFQKTETETIPSENASDRTRWHQGDGRYKRLEKSTALRTRKAVVGLFHIYGNSGMLAYITYMAERLEEMRCILKPTGSVYLHCDPMASHYLKLLMDAIFGKKIFEMKSYGHTRVQGRRI